MSYDNGLRAINMKAGAKLPQTEYIVNAEYLELVSDIDPLEDPFAASIRTYQLLDLDIVWVVFDSTEEFRTSETKYDETHKKAQYGIGAARVPIRKKVEDPHDIFDVDLDSYTGDLLMTQGENEISRQAHIQTALSRSALVPGVNSFTLFHNFQKLFEFEDFLVAALLYPQEFGRLIDLFGEIKLEIACKWAETDIKAVILHDDIAMSNGPFLRPQWFEDNIFPWYRRIFAKLKERDVKVIFISDGNMTALVDGVFAAGADGMCFDYTTDIIPILAEYGAEKLIIGGPDIRTILSGNEESVIDEVSKWIEIGKSYPGYVLFNGAGFAHDVPTANIKAYFDTCSTMRPRR